MNSKEIALGIVKAVLILLGIVLLGYFLYKIQSVILYLVVSLLLTMIGTPIVDFLKKKFKFKHTTATIFTLLFFGLIIIGFIALFIPLLATQGHKLSLLDGQGLQLQIKELLNQLKAFLHTKGIYKLDNIESFDFTKYINFTFLSDFLNSFIGTISNIGIGIASVFFITFFFLKERALFLRVFHQIIPDAHEDKILASVSKSNELLSRYFLGILLQLSIVFVLYVVVLLIFGVDNFLIIALLCALLNIIPYVGPLIGTVLAVILTLLGDFNGIFTADMFSTSLYVLIGFFVVQFIDNNFCQPFIFSNSTKSHPLEIFLIILIFGFLFGILGMIIAVPFYTILKVIAKEFLPENKLIQFLTKNM